MAKRSPTGALIAAVIWIVIIGAIAVAYRYFLHPRMEERLHRSTSSESQYKTRVRLALDSFSGYSIFRSDDMHKRLKAQGIKLELQDDGADYPVRLRALRDGDVDVAVFTIDSLITAGAQLGGFPGTIVMVIDETKGADAIIAYTNAVASLADLNDPSARIVLTPASPSEFLARVAIAHFDLPLLPDPWWVEKNGADEVYQAFLSADRRKRTAYVLWEPYVSRALEDEEAVVLLDSSQLQGYIVDVLVAQRDFLSRNPERVRAVVEAYLRSAHAASKGGGMADLLVKDAAKTEARGIDPSQAERLAAGIQWKNTLENYAHFGLLGESDIPGATHIEDMINQIVDVLIQTGAVRSDPLHGQANTLFYQPLLAGMQSDDFHPAKALNLLKEVGPGLEDLEKVRKVDALPALSDAEWKQLVRIGEMRIKPIVFARGMSRLNAGSRRNLSQLARRLSSYPHYYLYVVGHARAEGDFQANIALAKSRAGSAAEFLVGEGLHRNRVRTEAAEPSAGGGAAQSVSFVVGQRPY